MRLLGKIFVGFLVLAFLGMLFDDTPSLNNRLGEAIMTGKATDAQWEEYNKVLNHEAKLCVVVAANAKAKAGAWNPDGIAIDYTSAYAADDYVASNNRNPNPSYSGSVALSGTNAFGATVKSRVEGFGTMRLEKDGSKYVIRCR